MRAKETSEDIVIENEEMKGVETPTEEPQEQEKVEEQEQQTGETSETNEELEVLNNKLLRLQADYLNYKTRTEKEKIQTYGNAVAEVINCLLPVIDNFERALEADTSDGDGFKEGVKMIYEQLMGILEKKGLKEIEAIHKQFDPNFHYGVAFDAESEKEDGTIIEVFQKGYTVNDKVIRPSMVKISKK